MLNNCIQCHVGSPSCGLSSVIFYSVRSDTSYSIDRGGYVHADIVFHVGKGDLYMSMFDSMSDSNVLL